MKFLDKLFGKKKPETPGPFSGAADELAESSLLCNPAFTEAVRALTAEDSVVTREAAHRELLKLNIWIPLDEPLGPGNSDGMASISLQGVLLEDGTAAVAMFTDPFALKLFMGTEDLAMTTLPLSSLIEAVQSSNASDIVINRAGPAGMRLFKQELPYLAKGMSPYSREAIDEVFAHAPTEDEMLDPDSLRKLKSALSSEPNILTARMTIFEFNDAYSARMVGIQLADESESFDAIRQRLMEAYPDAPVTYSHLIYEEELEAYEQSGIPIYARP